MKKRFDITELVVNSYVIEYDETVIDDIEKHIEKYYDGDIWDAVANDDNIFEVNSEYIVEYLTSDMRSIHFNNLKE